MKTKLPPQTQQAAINRRHFLAVARTGSALGSAPLASAESATVSLADGIADCHPWVQSTEIPQPFRSLQLTPADEAMIRAENAPPSFPISQMPFPISQRIESRQDSLRLTQGLLANFTA